MRVLFIDEKDWGKKVPYTIHYLAEYMAKRGHEVFAIDYDDTWAKAHHFDMIAHEQRRSISKVLPGVTVDVTSPAFLKIPALGRISSLVTHYQAIAQLIRCEKIEAMVIYSVTNAAPTLWLARRMNIPVVFHSIDMLGPLVPHRILERPAELIEQGLIRFSDGVLALTPIFAERARRMGARRVDVIPNGVNTEILRPGLDTTALRTELGLRDEKIILFVGTITRHVGLDLFLQHFARMPRDNVKFVVVGDDIITAGRETRQLQELCRTLGIEESVIFTGLQPAQRVPLYINLADVCVSPFPPSKFSRFNIAMKVFEYMACGKPTVTFQLEGTKSLVPPGNGGVLYAESHEEMFGMISRLLADSERRQRLGQTGRQMVERHFSWDSVTADLERVLGDLHGEQRFQHRRQRTDIKLTRPEG
ncbi:MAG: glycosyltransferase family 4 protein [Oscillochloris sp.]|nr:glycosyltransferase family 4 protein [Oscillochloris sp.]